MSLFDLSLAVGLMATNAVTVTRYSSSPIGADGRALPKVGSSFTTQASVQPVSRMLARDPDGFGEKSDRVSVFSLEALVNGDRLVIASGSAAGTYEVELVEGWNTAGNYCEAIARKLDSDES